MGEEGRQGGEKKGWERGEMGRVVGEGESGEG